MAELNLGKVKGDDVTKASIENALGFSTKDIIITTQAEYDTLSTSKKKENILYFIKDEFGKILYNNKSIWKQQIPDYYVLGTDDDFEINQWGELHYIGEYEYIILPEVIQGVNLGTIDDFSPLFYEITHIKGVATDGAFLTSLENMFFDEEYTMQWESLDVRFLDTSKVENFTNVFFSETLKKIDGLEYWDMSSAVSIRNMFHIPNIKNKDLDISNWDTSNIQEFDSFINSDLIEEFDTSFIDTRNATKISRLIISPLITEIDYSHFDLTNVKNVAFFYANLSSLIEADISFFDGYKFESGEGMFSGCESITNVDAHYLDTSLFTSISTMFNRCKSITSLDLTSWDSTNFTVIFGAFGDMINLVTLDLSTWDLSKVTNSKGVLTGCNALETVYVRSEQEVNLLKNSSGCPPGINFIIK